MEDEPLGATGHLEELRGVAFAYRPYRRWSASWDHDHCDGCMVGFSEDSAEDLHEGWTTTAAYEKGAEYCWVCSECFDRHKDRLDWCEVTDTRPVRPRGLFANASVSPEGASKEPRPHDAW